jgi:PIN domain nuclease of toxin-antitoxin system
MRLLLDTHVLLWALLEDPRLSSAQLDAIGTGELYLSAASVWEIGIKRGIGKLDVPEEIFSIAANAGCRPLPISWIHAETAAALPHHHADPFDRMLIAQARCEGLRLVSSDARMKAYDVALVS